jgi:NAD(P)-dependent dehydrogenase (short-subunit alcohol dehydrogenase family)
MALSGKKILITGGAGFIGTTLARRLVDDNEIVAVDNLHRDALGGTELADHPNFTFRQGDVLDPELMVDPLLLALDALGRGGPPGALIELGRPVRGALRLVGHGPRLVRPLNTIRLWDHLENFARARGRIGVQSPSRAEIRNEAPMNATAITTDQ